MTLTAKQFTDEASRVEWNLTNHAPAPVQIEHIEIVRDYAKLLGKNIATFCPNSREKSLALTALEETTMWAVASIARAETTD
jgi:hypothetical protein